MCYFCIKQLSFKELKMRNIYILHLLPKFNISGAPHLFVCVKIQISPGTIFLQLDGLPSTFLEETFC